MALMGYGHQQNKKKRYRNSHKLTSLSHPEITRNLFIIVSLHCRLLIL